MAWIEAPFSEIVTIRSSHGNVAWKPESVEYSNAQGQLLIELGDGTTVFADLGEIPRGIGPAIVRDFLSQILVAAQARHFRPVPHARFMDFPVRAAPARDTAIANGPALTALPDPARSVAADESAAPELSRSAPGPRYIPLELPPRAPYVPLEPIKEESRNDDGTKDAPSREH